MGLVPAAVGPSVSCFPAAGGAGCGCYSCLQSQHHSHVPGAHLKTRGVCGKKAFCFPSEIASTSCRHCLCKCNCCVQPHDDWLRCACAHAAIRPTGAPLSQGLAKARRHGGEQAKDGDPLQITLQL